MNSRIKATLIAAVALILATAVALSVTMCGKKPDPTKNRSPRRPRQAAPNHKIAFLPE